MSRSRNQRERQAAAAREAQEKAAAEEKRTTDASAKELAEYDKELERSIELTRELLKEERELIENKQKIAALDKEFLNATEERKKAILEEKTAIVLGNEALSNRIKQLKEVATAEDNTAKALQSSTTTLLEATLGIQTRGNALTGLISLSKQGGSVTNALSKAFKGSAGAALRSNIALGLTTGIMNAFAEATFKAHKTSEQLVDTLGRQAGIATNRGQVDNLLVMAQNSDNAYASFERLGEATLSLQQATKGVFGNILETNKELPLFAAEMHGLGVSTSTTAELFGDFGMILGEDGVKQIKKLETQATLLARTTGLMSDDVIKDISGMSDSLAAFGSNSDDIALDIAKISATTKVSSKSILGFAEKFEHFDGAMDMTRNLNLLFGQSVIDGQEMFEMVNDGTLGPGEAFKTLLKSTMPLIDETFVNSPNKMRRFARTLSLAPKEAAKLAQQLLETKNAGESVEEMLAKTKKGREEEAKAMKVQASLTQALDKLQQSLAISMAPVVELLSQFVDLISGIDPATLRMIAGGLAGATAGFVAGGPIGAAIGAVAGAGIAGAAGSMNQIKKTEALKDGVVTVKGNQITATPVDSRDDLAVMAKQPGGPLASMGLMGSTRSGPQTVEVGVNLFGTQLKNIVVDLMQAEMRNRKMTQEVVQGA